MTLIALLMLVADPLAEPLPEVVLLDFTASYCGPCQEMVPAIQSMEKAHYPIRRVDITKNPEIFRQFQVELIPTFILLVNDQEKKRIVGRCSEDELRRIMIAERDALQAQTKSDQESALPPSNTRVLDQDQRPSGLRGLFAMIRDGFGGRRQSTGFLHPTFRAQSPQPLSTDTAGENAMAATVRIRVTKPGNKEDIGTGSVIHSTTKSSMILTCAHLLRGPAQGLRVEVEFFRDGRTFKYPADIVAHDDELELAILQIRNHTQLPTVELAPISVGVMPGSAAFSIGCDHGQLPTHIPIKVVDINRYNGPSNIVCTVDPAVGRSGGGLFNSGGQLIGVCSCADRDHHEGLYMGRQAIHQLFAAAQLSHLLESGRDSGNRADFSPESDLAEDELIAALFNDDSTVAVAADDGRFTESSADSAMPLVEPAAEQNQTGDRTATRDHADSRKYPLREITVIVDSLDGSRPKEVVVIKRPSPWLLELLTGEAPVLQHPTAVGRDELLSSRVVRTLHPAALRRTPATHPFGRHRLPDSPPGRAVRKRPAQTKADELH